MIIPKSDSQVLQEVRRLLVEEGWTQGIMERWVPGEPHPRYCVAGALYIACCHDNPQFWRMVDLLGAQAIKTGWLSAGAARHQLTHWNDRPTRTKDDVLALIDKALEAVTK